MDPAKWDLAVGQAATRTSLHARFGGSQSRGISAPAIGSGRHELMLWWRPEGGESFGYSDGWGVADSAFYFTGTGQVGDQRFEAPNSENGRVRDHHANGDAIRLLRYVGKNEVVYLGRFRLDPVDPWQWRDGPDRYGVTRKMIQFRLLPIVPALRSSDDPQREEPAAAPTSIPLDPVPVLTPVETLRSIDIEQVIEMQRRLSSRVELQLVHRFHEWLAARNVASTGLLIPYAPERRNLRADLYLPVASTLVEAKATASRESLRMAIGQLLDYARWLTPRPRLLVLLPSTPSDDMIALLESLSIGVAWPNSAGFRVRPELLIEPPS